MRQWIALLLMALTLEQLRSAECRVACGYIGYDSGAFWKTYCYCVDFKDYSELTNRKRIILPKKSKGRALVSPSYSDPTTEPETYRGYPKEIDDYLF